MQLEKSKQSDFKTQNKNKVECSSERFVVLPPRLGIYSARSTACAFVFLRLAEITLGQKRESIFLYEGINFEKLRIA